MKHLLIMLTTTLLLQQAIAQTDTSVAVNKVIVSVAKSVNKIDVYKKSFDSVPAYQINSKDLVLPLQVSRQDEDFLLMVPKSSCVMQKQWPAKNPVKHQRQSQPSAAPPQHANNSSHP